MPITSEPKTLYGCIRNRILPYYIVGNKSMSEFTVLIKEQAKSTRDSEVCIEAMGEDL